MQEKQWLYTTLDKRVPRSRDLCDDFRRLLRACLHGIDHLTASGRSGRDHARVRTTKASARSFEVYAESHGQRAIRVFACTTLLHD